MAYPEANGSMRHPVLPQQEQTNMVDPPLTSLAGAEVSTGASIVIAGGASDEP
jgi:hypothetical protein